MSERRGHNRQKAPEYYIVMDKAAEKVLGRVENMTLEGLKLISENQIEDNMIYSCRMALPERINNRNQIVFVAQSKWCREDEGSKFYECGYQILSLSDENRETLEKLLEIWKAPDPVVLRM